MIDSYKFGEMIINGKRYTSDLIVFPEKIFDSWWRKEGHKVHVQDLTEIIKYQPKPELLVLGTGYHGLVKISAEVKSLLETHGIELIAEPTIQAWQTFNRLSELKSRIAGAFHLTC